jgi:hypothetical protein
MKATSPKQVEFEKLMHVSRLHFLVRDEQMFRSRTLRASPNYHSEWVGLSNSLTAFLQLHFAYLDCFTSRPLLMRVKNGSRIPKSSDIIRYHWLSFHGFVYVYCEKIKLVADQLSLVDVKLGPEIRDMDFPRKIKDADLVFKKSKALRGSLVHSWHVEHPRIRFLNGLELLKDSPNKDMPSGFYDLNGHLIDVKRDVGLEIKNWESRLSSFHMPVAENLSDALVSAIERFNDMHCDALLGSA